MKFGNLTFVCIAVYIHVYITWNIAQTTLLVGGKIWKHTQPHIVTLLYDWHILYICQFSDPVEFIEEPQDVYGIIGGGDINLSCFTRGNPLPLPALFSWSNGTSQLFSQSRVSITTTTNDIGYEHTTNSTLTISSATIYDTGEYTCKVQNFIPPVEYRSIEGKVNLVIQCKIAIRDSIDFLSALYPTFGFHFPLTFLSSIPPHSPHL